MTPEIFKRSISRARSIDTTIPNVLLKDIDKAAKKSGYVRHIFLKHLMLGASDKWAAWYNTHKSTSNEITDEVAERLIGFAMLPCTKETSTHISFVIDTKTRKIINDLADNHRLRLSQAIRLLIAIGLEFKVVKNGR